MKKAPPKNRQNRQNRQKQQKQAKRKILGEIMIDKAEHLHTQNMLEELNQIVKRFFSEYYALPHEYTIEEIPGIVQKKSKGMGEVFYRSVTEFSGALTQKRYSGGSVTKEELQDLVKEFERIIEKLTSAGSSHTAEKKELERQEDKAREKETEMKRYHEKLSMPIEPENPKAIRPEKTIEKKVEPEPQHPETERTKSEKQEARKPVKPVIKRIKSLFVEENHNDVIKLKKESGRIRQMASKAAKIRI
ncbi:hypothetical protein JW968_07250 [Candidatus Woesearchaeota archaeon]|nr:hypothetical protein [Candidatus Woesearchaeota archaeon]